MDQEMEKKAAEAAQEAAEAVKTEKREETPKPGGNKDSSQKAPQKKKKKKKYKLQTMDIVTIVFTAVIVGIMAYVLYNQFAGKKDGGGSAAPTATNSATAAPTATPKPALTDIGNLYGNVTNDADVVVIDKREYFISADENGETHIYAAVGETTKDLIRADASSLNVITDYITYADQSNVTAYYVFYINGDGKICYVYDGPVGGDALEEKTNLEEKTFLDGKYRSIDVSGAYVYYLDENGQIGKADIASGETTVLGSERAYQSFVLYNGVIYAAGQEDGFIYAMPSSPSAGSGSSASPTASASPSPTSGTGEGTEKEKALIREACRNFVIDDEWIYVLGENGIVRYMIDGGGKDTLSVQAEAINVYKGAIFYIQNGELYTADADALLVGKATKISASFGKNSINISDKAVYLKNEAGKLLKSAYDSANSAYGEFSEMN